VLTRSDITSLPLLSFGPVDPPQTMLEDK